MKIIKRSSQYPYELEQPYAELLNQAKQKVQQLREELAPWEELYQSLDSLYSHGQSYEWYKYRIKYNIGEVDRKAINYHKKRMGDMKRKVEFIRKKIGI